PQGDQSRRQAGHPRAAGSAGTGTRGADAAADRWPPRLQRVLRQQELRLRGARSARSPIVATDPGQRPGFVFMVGSFIIPNKAFDLQSMTDRERQILALLR